MHTLHKVYAIIFCFTATTQSILPIGENLNSLINNLMQEKIVSIPHKPSSHDYKLTADSLKEHLRHTESCLVEAQLLHYEKSPYGSQTPIDWFIKKFPTLSTNEKIATVSLGAVTIAAVLYSAYWVSCKISNTTSKVFQALTKEEKQEKDKNTEEPKTK